MFEVHSQVKIQVWEKDWSQQVKIMQVHNGTGSGVWRSECPLSACHTRHKCHMETSNNSVKYRGNMIDDTLVLSVIGVYVN